MAVLAVGNGFDATRSAGVVALAIAG